MAFRLATLNVPCKGPVLTIFQSEPWPIISGILFIAFLQAKSEALCFRLKDFMYILNMYRFRNLAGNVVPPYPADKSIDFTRNEFNPNKLRVNSRNESEGVVGCGEGPRASTTSDVSKIMVYRSTWNEDRPARVALWSIDFRNLMRLIPISRRHQLGLVEMPRN
jgi:hypothetical protein